MHNYHIVSILGLGLVLAMSGTLLPPSSTGAAEQKPTMAAAPTRNAAVASGAVEDTLTVCLARIPQVATPGQRLIAEQSCHRDESGRASMQAVPGRQQ